jgi:hypothetical protein
MQNTATRNQYPSDNSDEDCARFILYLTLMIEDAPQHGHDLREVFNGLRWMRVGVFEAIVSEQRALIRLGEGKAERGNWPKPSRA